jgi:phytoene synthase
MGIAGHLRLLPIHRSRGQCFVPVDLLAKHGLEPANLIAGRPEIALAAVMQEMRSTAAIRLREARQRQAAIAPDAFPAFLPAALTDIYLRRLDALGAAALKRVAEVAQLRRQWRLYWSATLKRF